MWEELHLAVVAMLEDVEFERLRVGGVVWLTSDPGSGSCAMTCVEGTFLEHVLE